MENPPDISEDAECPFCFERMTLEERDRSTWLVCPNGCPTEAELVPRKPPASEAEPPLTRSHKAGSSG